MPQHNVGTLLETNRYDLSEAVLLYRSTTEPNAYASVHDVVIGQNGVPVIGAGAPLSRERLVEWTKALRSEPPLSYIPDTILARSSDALVWWVPASLRESYFNLTAKFTESLSTLTGKCVRKLPYPPLLLAATHDNLYVYALRANRRPAPTTILYRSPILNVYTDATLCWGSIARPAIDTPDATVHFEKAIFESWSTHPNDEKQPAVSFKGGTPALWDHLAATNAERFPLRVLKPIKNNAKAAPMTLSTLLKQLTA